MGQIYFYHLTSTPLEGTLPMLVGKARDAGWRIALRGQAKSRLEWLDQYLWTHPPESFLPHGISGGQYDADQPVLLTTDTENKHAADCLMAFDGALVTAEEVMALERVCLLFDGNDTDAVDHARTQWKSLTGAGCAAQYWAQDGGRWSKKAQHPAEVSSA